MYEVLDPTKISIYYLLCILIFVKLGNRICQPFTNHLQSLPFFTFVHKNICSFLLPDHILLRFSVKQFSYVQVLGPISINRTVLFSGLQNSDGSFCLFISFTHNCFVSRMLSYLTIMLTSQLILGPSYMRI